MDLYSYFLCDVTFGEGSLYFSVKKNDNDLPIVKSFRQTDKGYAAPIERLDAIHEDDFIIAINGESTLGLPFKEIKEKLAKTPRPMTIRFAKPIPKNEWKKIVLPSGETITKQWVTTHYKLIYKRLYSLINIYGYLPVKKYDLSSHDADSLVSLEEWKENATPLTPLTVKGDLFECDIRQHCFNGSPDMITRALYWKMLLGYLPYTPSKWEEKIKNSIEEYKEFVNEFIINKNKECGKENCAIVPSPIDLTWKNKDNKEESDSIGNGDDEDNESPWSKSFGETELRDIIWKDTQRTYSDLEFFNQDSKIMFSRMLYIFAKLNPGVKYVQGMNELLAPLFMVFSQANKDNGGEELCDEVEADTFFCFNQLMSECRDLFIRQMDSDNTGINGVFNKLDNYIKIHVKDAADVLDEQELSVQFYALRWMTTLFAREFDLEHTYRVWDCFFADPDRFQFMYCFGTAMIKRVKDKIIMNSFGENMKLLQNYECENINKVLKTANKIRDHEIKRTNGMQEEVTSIDAIVGKSKEFLNKSKDIVGEQVKKGWFNFKTVGLPKLNELAKTTLTKATEISKSVESKAKELSGKDFKEISQEITTKSKEFGQKSKEFGQMSLDKGKKWFGDVKEKAESQMNNMKEKNSNRKPSKVEKGDEIVVTDTSSEEETTPNEDEDDTTI
ncbi:hypothetical protein WA158_001330 [Blastocystis sp. Blastoise]